MKHRQSEQAPRHRVASPEEDSSKKKDRKGKIVKNTAKVAAGLAILGGVAGISDWNKHPHSIGEVGFTPNPPVSSMSTEVLIELNDAGREYGPYGLLLGGGAFAAYEVLRRRKDSYAEGMHDITHDASRRNRAIFAGVVMAFVGTSSGLGHAAGEGANQQVHELATSLGADINQSSIITEYNNVPYNPSNIDYDAVSHALSGTGATTVPFKEDLGSIKDPAKPKNEASAEILFLPNSVLQHAGYNLPAVADCNEASVIIGNQLGVTKNNPVDVNDRPVHVADTVDIKSGIGRISVLGSIEQSECINEHQPMTGAVVLGMDGKRDEVAKALHGAHLPYVARSLQQYEDAYTKFWNESVKPSEMNFVLDVLLLGGIALGNMQLNEIMSRRKRIGVMLAQGVDEQSLSRAHTIASLRDSVIGMPVFAGTTTALTMLNESSQYGLSQAVDMAGLGMGFGAFVLTSAVSSWRSNKMIKHTNAAKQLRTGA